MLQSRISVIFVSYLYYFSFSIVYVTCARHLFLVLCLSRFLSHLCAVSRSSFSVPFSLTLVFLSVIFFFPSCFLIFNSCVFCFVFFCLSPIISHLAVLSVSCFLSHLLQIVMCFYLFSHFLPFIVCCLSLSLFLMF